MNFGTLDDLSLYANTTEGDCKPFKSTSSVELGVTSSWESFEPSPGFVRVDSQQPETRIQGFLQTIGSTVQCMSRSVSQPSLEILPQHTPQLVDRSKSVTSHPSFDQALSHLMHQSQPQPQPQSQPQPQVPSQPLVQSADQDQFTSQLQSMEQRQFMPQHPPQLTFENDCDGFLSEIFQGVTSSPESEGQGEILGTQLMNTEREVPDVTSAITYQTYDKPVYKHQSPPDDQTPGTDTQPPHQSGEHLPHLEQFLDLNQLISRPRSNQQLVNDSGFLQTIPTFEDSPEQSMESLDVEARSTERMEAIKEKAKASRRGRRLRSRDELDPNSPDYKEHLDKLSQKDRQRELNRQAAKRHRDKKFKHTLDLEVRAEYLKEERGRLVAERRRLWEEQTTLLRTKRFHRCEQ